MGWILCIGNNLDGCNSATRVWVVCVDKAYTTPKEATSILEALSKLHLVGLTSWSETATQDQPKHDPFSATSARGFFDEFWRK